MGDDPEQADNAVTARTGQIFNVDLSVSKRTAVVFSEVVAKVCAGDTDRAITDM